jgi:NAD(P)-dependent dehydrogenase (short-subunit alcohol dehydrogenase family)
VAAKSILITGTSSGIGLAASVELARRGERVFASMRDVLRAGPLRASAAAAGVEVEVIQLDVTDPASVERAVDDVLEAAGKVDVLVNNAGMVGPGALELASEEETHLVFETNVFGPLRVIRAVLPGMRERRQGRIVNLSSGARWGAMGHRLMGLYSSSKAALSSLTEELCKEVAPLGIEVVLMESLGGRTAMIDNTVAASRGLAPESSPYRIAERIHQVQWEWVDAAPDTTAATAAVVADAATIPNPPFWFPPRDSEWEQTVARLPDAHFLRLSRLDLDPGLYERASGFWAANHIVAGEAAD